MTIKIKCKEPGCDKYVKYTPPSAPVLFTLREGNSFLEMTCSDKHTHEYDLTEDVPDDQKDFWLKLAETNIESAHKTINTASSKISSTIVQLWGWYTGTFIIGSFLNKVDEEGWVLFFFVLPIPLLLIAYMLGLWAGMPYTAKDVIINVKDWTAVANLYSKSVNFRRGILSSALIVTCVSIISVAIALWNANFYKKKEEKDPIPLGMVDISVLNTDSSFYVISYGNIEEGSSITMQIDTLVDSVYVLADIKPGIVLTKDSFDIHTVLPSKPMKTKVTVAWWKESGPRRTIIKEFE